MKILLPVFLSMIIFASGCASMQELTKEVINARNSGKEGVTKVYPVTEKQAWDITRAVFHWEKTEEIEEHPDQGYVITSTGMKMLAFGSVMGVWIEPVDSDNTRITVIAKRRVKTDTFTDLTPSKFYERFDEGVKILKSGKKLTATPPLKQKSK
jgi:hypothetical protein